MTSHSDPPDSPPAGQTHALAQRHLNAGLTAASQGNWRAAVEAFQAAVDAAPEWSDGHHNLSIALTHAGDLPGALEAARRATERGPTSSAAWLNLGNLAARSNEIQTAQHAFQAVLKSDSTNTAAHLNLGLVLSAQNLWAEAVPHLEQAHRAQPNAIQTLVLLARALRYSGQAESAVRFLSEALDKAPEDILIRIERAVAHLALNDLTAAEHDANAAVARDPESVEAALVKVDILERAERWPEHDAVLAETHKQRPDHILIAEKLAARLIAQGKPEDALSAARATLEHHPRNSDALNLLGTCLWESIELGDAINAYEAALTETPNHLHALQNLASLHFETHDFIAAQEYAERARTAHPSDQRILNTLARTYLARGQLADGWDLGEHPDCLDRAPARSWIDPDKDWWGKDLDGETLRIRPEQGIGDELRFATCFPDAIAEAGTCIIECDPRLAPAFRRTFPEAEIKPQPLDQRGTNSAPDFDFDVECLAGSLPRRYRRSSDAFPESPVILQTDPALNAKWRARLDDLGPTFKIGLCWRSNVIGSTRMRRFFYTHLDDWKEVYDIEGVSIVNLFPGDASAELSALKDRLGVSLHQWDDLDLREDVEDVLSLVHELDLVISVQAAVWAFAGAVGKDSIVLLNPNVLLGHDHVPWFPSLEPITSMWSKPWPEVSRDIAERVRNRMARKTPGMR